MAQKQQHRIQKKKGSPSLIRSRTSSSPRGESWQSIYDSLREEIVSMRLKPGEALPEKELANRFAVSRTPLREAIFHLKREGLVDVIPQSGTYVAAIPLDQLEEATVIRKALEGAAIRHATLKMSKSQQLTLAATVEKMREAMEADEREDFHAEDESFHRQIAEISGYPGIWRMVAQVKTQLDRFRRITLLMEERMPRVIGEHARILDAMEAGDPEEAEKAMSDHLSRVLVKLPSEFSSLASSERTSVTKSRTS